MEVDCIYAGPGGASRIARVKLPTLEKIVGADGKPAFTGSQGAEGWGISTGPAGSAEFGEWHTAQPLMSIVLAGEWEVETGSGERRVLGPGSLTVFLDDSGQGHRSRVTSPIGCRVLGLRLDAVSVADLKAQIG